MKSLQTVNKLKILALFLWIMSLFSISQPVKANTNFGNLCTGDYYLCVTRGKSGWSRQPAHNTNPATATINISNFTWPTNPANYPIYSSVLNIPFTYYVALTQQSGSKGPYSGLSLSGQATSNMTYVSEYSAFHINGTPNNLLFKFTISLTSKSNGTTGSATATPTATIPLNFSTGILGSAQTSEMSIQVQAIAIGDVGNEVITIKNKTKLFNMLFSATGDQAIGEIYIDGSSKIPPPTPPAPATCDITTTGDRVFTLADITLDQIATAGSEAAAAASQNVVINCPAARTVQLWLADSVTSSNTGDYLTVRSGTVTTPLGTSTAATNVGVRMYYNDSQKITMGNANLWSVSAVKGNNTLPFKARYYNPSTGAVTPGLVRSEAVLNVNYP